MLLLYEGSMSSGFELAGSPYQDDATNELIYNICRVLERRGQAEAAQFLATFKFLLYNASNFHGAEFYVLHTIVPLAQYEYIRDLLDSPDWCDRFIAMAQTFREFHYDVSFIACEMELNRAPANWRSHFRDTSADANLQTASQARNTLLENTQSLQDLCISYATGGGDEPDEYARLRRELTSDGTIPALLPEFVRDCRSPSQFWSFIKNLYSTYEERRAFLWAEFRPLLNAIERGSLTPVDASAALTLERFDSENVHAVWAKAVERRTVDPEGAITAARTLLETVCKHILDDGGEKYNENIELPKLYKLTANSLNMAPDQHSQEIFKRILGGCSSVVEGLGTLRNKLSDAHGRGKRTVRPAPRHAELAVNLAGTMAAFLVETWEARKGSAS